MNGLSLSDLRTQSRRRAHVDNKIISRVTRMLLHQLDSFHYTVLAVQKSRISLHRGEPHPLTISRSNRYCAGFHNRAPSELFLRYPDACHSDSEIAAFRCQLLCDSFACVTITNRPFPGLSHDSRHVCTDSNPNPLPSTSTLTSPASASCRGPDVPFVRAVITATVIPPYASSDEPSACSATHAFGDRKVDLRGYYLYHHHASTYRPAE